MHAQMEITLKKRTCRICKEAIVKEEMCLSVGEYNNSLNICESCLFTLYSKIKEYNEEKNAILTLRRGKKIDKIFVTAKEIIAETGKSRLPEVGSLFRGGTVKTVASTSKFGMYFIELEYRLQEHK